MTISTDASGSPSIRPAVPGDAPAAARMRYAFRAELGTPNEPEDAFVARCGAWMAERLASGAWRGWIAEDGGGAMVGQAWVQLVEKMPNPVDEAELHAYVTNCYVLPGMRGGGI
ncbi:MAG TPA: hypothetical protein VFR81_04710, partial [Longimicrobium sp.]|nr:hypothetical protein [Longimicrobium sp.]